MNAPRVRYLSSLRRHVTRGASKSKSWLSENARRCAPRRWVSGFSVDIWKSSAEISASCFRQGATDREFDGILFITLVAGDFGKRRIRIPPWKSSVLVVGEKNARAEGRSSSSAISASFELPEWNARWTWKFSAGKGNRNHSSGWPIQRAVETSLSAPSFDPRTAAARNNARD